MSAFSDKPSIDQLQACLRDVSSPVGLRMRSTYFLRQSYDEDESSRMTVLDCLGSSLKNEKHGPLLRHEFAYVLGQLRDDNACDDLEEVLCNTRDNSMVRHEAAEALGAIGAPRSLEPLRTCSLESCAEVAEACSIALAHMEWKLRSGAASEEPTVCACMASPYSSVDPAPPHPSHVNLTVVELASRLLDASLPLFERYRCMFSLRNIGGGESVTALGNALTSDESSALLRHELAYVLGQMQHGAALEALSDILRRKNEHCMVRHEAAEALGAIEGRFEETRLLLEEFAKDEDEVVRQSCEVALDSVEYFSGNDKSLSDDCKTPLGGFAAQKAATLQHFNTKEEEEKKDRIVKAGDVLGH